MRTRLLVLLGVSAVAVASLSPPLAAQSPPAQEPPVKLQPAETPVAGECLTKEELALNKGLQALRRPTLGAERNGEGDDPPRFNPHYFLGKWVFDGVVPESPLGAAGELTGVETVRSVDACTFESTIQVKGPDGAFTVKTLTAYDRKKTYMVRLEQDSRGFQLLKIGPVGGDSGGYFTHHWEVPQFTYKGRKVRLKGTTFLASPDNHRLRMQISVDGGPFVSYGTLWSRREGTAKP